MKTAKWEDLRSAWQNDCVDGDLCLLNKITEGHIEENKMKKIKVSVAAQTFSRTFASVINLMAGNGNKELHYVLFVYSGSE